MRNFIIVKDINIVVTIFIFIFLFSSGAYGTIFMDIEGNFTLPVNYLNLDNIDIASSYVISNENTVFSLSDDGVLAVSPTYWGGTIDFYEVNKLIDKGWEDEASEFMGPETGLLQGVYDSISLLAPSNLTVEDLKGLENGEGKYNDYEEKAKRFKALLDFALSSKQMSQNLFTRFSEIEGLGSELLLTRKEKMNEELNRASYQARKNLLFHPELGVNPVVYWGKLKFYLDDLPPDVIKQTNEVLKNIKEKIKEITPWLERYIDNWTEEQSDEYLGQLGWMEDTLEYLKHIPGFWLDDWIDNLTTYDDLTGSDFQTDILKIITALGVFISVIEEDNYEFGDYYNLEGELIEGYNLLGSFYIMKSNLEELLDNIDKYPDILKQKKNELKELFPHYKNINVIFKNGEGEEKQGLNFIFKEGYSNAVINYSYIGVDRYEDSNNKIVEYYIPIPEKVRVYTHDGKMLEYDLAEAIEIPTPSDSLLLTLPTIGELPNLSEELPMSPPEEDSTGLIASLVDDFERYKSEWNKLIDDWKTQAVVKSETQIIQNDTSGMETERTLYLLTDDIEDIENGKLYESVKIHNKLDYQEGLYEIKLYNQDDKFIVGMRRSFHPELNNMVVGADRPLVGYDSDLGQCLDMDVKLAYTMTLFDVDNVEENKGMSRTDQLQTTTWAVERMKYIKEAASGDTADQPLIVSNMPVDLDLKNPQDYGIFGELVFALAEDELKNYQKYSGYWLLRADNPLFSPKTYATDLDPVTGSYE